jgi:hypothetical protein
MPDALLNSGCSRCGLRVRAALPGADAGVWEALLHSYLVGWGEERVVYKNRCGRLLADL